MGLLNAQTADNTGDAANTPSAVFASTYERISTLTYFEPKSKSDLGASRGMAIYLGANPPVCQPHSRIGSDLAV